MAKKTFKGEKVKSVKLDDCKMPKKEITFGQFVKYKRFKKGFSQRKFCEALNMTSDQAGYWSQVEKGNLPFDEEIIQLSDITKILNLNTFEKRKLFELAMAVNKIKPKEDPIFNGIPDTPYQKYIQRHSKNDPSVFDVRLVLNRLKVDTNALSDFVIETEKYYEFKRIEALLKAIQENIELHDIRLVENSKVISYAEEMLRRLKNIYEINKTMSDVKGGMLKDSVMADYKHRIID